MAHIIAGLASLGPGTGLVFKGGTALRMCHFDEYRYSADLDFSIVAGSAFMTGRIGFARSIATAVTGVMPFSVDTIAIPTRIAVYYIFR